MIKNYFKQAWQLLKENKLYSTIYIFGTALAICMVMVISVFLFIKRGNITPEVHRSRSLYVQSIETTPKDTTEIWSKSYGASLQTLKQVFYPLTSAKIVTSYTMQNEDYSLSTMDKSQYKAVVARFTDANYWQAFKFHFIEGSPYTQEEFTSGVRNIIIDEFTSKRLFKGESPIGQRVLLSNEEYRVSGVVRNVSYLLRYTFANVWVPYTTIPNYDKPWDDEGALGGYKVIIIASSRSEFNEIKREVDENIQQYVKGLECNIDLLGQPDDTITSAFRNGNRPVKMNKIYWILGGLFFIFTIVPVLNLSGLNSSRMVKRSSEIGVRKAFGGTRIQLIYQIIIENLLLTFLGGILGFVLSYLTLKGLGTYLIPSETMYSASDVSMLFDDNLGITPQMLFSAEVFVIALILVFIINFLSTLTPALKFTRKNIVTALAENKK